MKKKWILLILFGIAVIVSLTLSYFPGTTERSVSADNPSAVKEEKKKDSIPVFGRIDYQVTFAQGDVYHTGFPFILSGFNAPRIKVMTTTDTAIINGYGGNDIIALWYDVTGDLTWYATAGGPGDDKVCWVLADTIGKAIYLTGYISQTAIFSDRSVTSQGERDLFLAKYDYNRKLQWVVSGGSARSDVSMFNDKGEPVEPMFLMINNSGVHVYATFFGECTFGSITQACNPNGSLLGITYDPANGKVRQIALNPPDPTNH